MSTLIATDNPRSTSPRTGDAATTVLPKSRSLTSLTSSIDTESSGDNSPTLCESIAKWSATEAHSHSREIVFEDLSPEDLNFELALGDRSPETIESLRINRCRMDAAAFASLTDVLCLHNLPRLRSVDISQNQVGGGTGELAGKALCKLLTHASSISTLSLGWNKLTLSDLRHMVPPSTGVGAPVVYGVNYLDLRANPLTPPAKHSNSKRRNAESADTSGSETWLPALVDSLPHLTHVLLAQATISDGMLAALLRSLARPSAHIEYIGLEWLGLGNRLSVLRAILSNLSPPPTRRSLHLNLSANNLGDAGVQAIASSNAVLSSLTLSCNFITERGTACLAQWLPASGLTDLDLSDNHFGDQGVSALVSMAVSSLCPQKNEPHVRSSSSVGEVGSGSLERSSSIYYTQIKSLGLASCCLSDTSLRLLATALDCRWAPLLSLRILRNSRISPGMKIALSPR